MKLRAYVDESGTHDQATHMVMGGVVSSFEKWKRFEPKWEDALQRWNGGEPIHARELIKRHHNVELVDALFDATKKRVGFGLTVAIKRSNFKEHYKTDSVPKGVQLDSEYGLLFGAWIETARSYARDLYSDQSPTGLWIVLERSVNFGSAAAVYDQLEEDQGPNEVLPLRGFSSGTKELPGIQLSDMTCHMGWRRESRYDPQAEADKVSGKLLPSHLQSRNDDEPFPVFRNQMTPEFLADLRQRIVSAHEKRKHWRARQRG